MSKTATTIGIVLLLGVGIYAGATLQKKAPQQKPLEIKWLIAHEPITLFDRAAQDFATEFNKDGNGTVHITILGPKDYGSTTGTVPTKTVLDALDKGDVQMASLPVAGLASTSAPELGVINLPFLFKNYASAEKVFDAPVGVNLLSSIDAHTNEKGLAFTFSGGFMIIESDTKQILTANDFKGKNIGTTQGQVARWALAAFGAVPARIDPNNGVAANSKLVDQYDGIEIPYTRIFPEVGQKPKYITETFHSLFTTAIVVNKTFLNSLSPQNQTALQKAAQVAATDERADSISLAAKHRADLIAGGTIVTTLSTSSVEQLMAAGQAAYQQYEAIFGSTTVEQIEVQQ